MREGTATYPHGRWSSDLLEASLVRVAGTLLGFEPSILTRAGSSYGSVALGLESDDRGEERLVEYR